MTLVYIVVVAEKRENNIEMLRMLQLLMLAIIMTASYTHAGLSLVQFHRISSP